MKLSTKKIDHSKVEKGVEIKDIPGWGDLALFARGTNNGDWRNLRARLVAETSPADILPDGNIKPTRTDQIAIECLVEAGITGWSGLTDDDDVDLPFSKEALRDILVNPDNMLFRGACTWACDKVHDFAAKRSEADAKN